MDVASDRWYQPRTFRLRLTSGDASTTWDEDARVLTVRLPQATTACSGRSSRSSGGSS